MTTFTEDQLEQAIISLLENQGYPHHRGDTLTRNPSDVLLRDDLRDYLSTRYAPDGITTGEIASIVRKLDSYSPSDLYESNKAIQKLVADGLLLKREDRSKKDLYIQLIDYRGLPLQRLPKKGEVETVDGSLVEGFAGYAGDGNRYRIVNQLEVEGLEKRILAEGGGPASGVEREAGLCG